MMTLDEIQVANIDMDVAREALTQADKRLADLNATKDAIERKAASLFGGYVTVSLALLTIGVALRRTEGFTWLPAAFFSAGTCLVVALILLAFLFADRDYGMLGSHPDMWLNKGTVHVSSSSAVLPHMLAYIAFHHASRIEASEVANEAKINFLRWAIMLGVAAPCFLVFFAAMN